MNNQGRYEAFAGQPGHVGRSLAEVPGVNVRKLLDDAFSDATDNDGWVDYELIKPISGKIEQKTTHAKKLSPTSFLGCGIYRAA